MVTTLKNKAKIAAWVLGAVAVATAPATVSAVNATSNTTINATVNAVVSISSGPSVAISLTPTAGGVVSSASDTVTVSTNNSAGYTLSMKDADTSANLVSGGNNITPHASLTTPGVLVNGTWGWAVNSGTTGVGISGFDASYSAENNNVSSTSNWVGVPLSSGSASTIKATSTTASNDATTVWYAARVNASQPTGVYTDTVTYTATTN